MTSTSKIVLQLSPHPDQLPKLMVRNKNKKHKDEMQVDPNDWSNQEGRYMKSSDQVKILENEFSKEPSWSKDKMKKLARLLNLKDSQIYKWNWDRRQLQDKYLMKRIADKDLPDNLFKVTKQDKFEID